MSMPAKTVTVQLHGLEETFDIVSRGAEATPRDGWMTLNAEKLAKVGKFIGTMDGSILLVLGVLALLASFMAGIKFDRSRLDRLNFQGRNFVMVGLANVPGTPNVFIPVYKDEGIARQQELEAEKQGRH